MKPLFSVIGAAAILSLSAGCAAYRSGEWPRLNYEDPGAPVVGEGTATGKPSAPPPPGAVAATPALAELAAEFDRLSGDSEAQLLQLRRATESLDGDDEDARRRAWLSLQLELSRLNRLRGELAGLVQSGEELTGREVDPTSELQELRQHMQGLSERLAVAAREAERRLKAMADSNAGQ